MLTPARLTILHAQGLSDKDIAAQCGVHVKTAGNLRNRLGLPVNRNSARPWTKDEVNALRDLVRSGKTDLEISEVIGRSYKGVQGKRKALKVRGNYIWTVKKVEGVQTRPPPRAPSKSGPAQTPDAQEQRLRRACAEHLVDLMREYGGGTVGRAKAAYRARCELRMVQGKDLPFAVPGSRVVFSFCSSAMGWL